MERKQLLYWRPLDTDPRYEVSNTGLLKRVQPGRGTWVGRITQGAMRADGYLQVFGISGGFNMMHQVVAHVFYGPCPAGYEPNHKDGVRHNNHKSNLEYLTKGDNIKHGFNQLHPERQELRAQASTRNAAKATAAVKTGGRDEYERTPALRARLRAKGKAQVQWWAKAGFVNLKAALDARKELP